MYVLFISYSLVKRHGLTCAPIGRRLDPVKWGSGDLFFVIYVRSFSVGHWSSFRRLFHELTRVLFLKLLERSMGQCSIAVEHHMTRDQIELPLAQTSGMAGALCGLSYEGSCLSCLTTAHLRFKTIGKLTGIDELWIDCTTSYVRHPSGETTAGPSGLHYAENQDCN
jgi:hypothetical protein